MDPTQLLNLFPAPLTWHLYLLLSTKYLCFCSERVLLGLRCKTLCDVLYDTLGEFGAIQA